MKLLIRDYVSSLKERQELDAILPDLLSELGYNVISRPGRGTTQRGVDIAAVRKDEKGREKVYLFSVKPGDLSRQEWDGNSQKLRSSLNEILDEYIPQRIPAAYRKCKVVVVLCLGGDIHESARSLVTAFTKRNTKGKVSFEEWNGDKIAELLLTGVLREELLPKPLRSSFQKAVAMVDQPDIAFEHFGNLVTALRKGAVKDKDKVRAARQMYICLWVLFVWARDIDNVDAPYRCSEAVLLQLWQMVRAFIGKKNATARGVISVLQHTINLHIQISGEMLDKILAHAGRRAAISTAVASRSPVDVNLKLFDILGRLGMAGHWALWVATVGGQPLDPAVQAALERAAKSGMQMINNNPALYLPIQDDQAIDMALFLVFAVRFRAFDADIHTWLKEMASRLDIAVRSNGRYPYGFSDYQDLIAHPRERSAEYRKEALAGSILIPLLAAWLAGFKDQDALDKLIALKAGDLTDCTLQLWLPEKESEDHLYLNDDMHGAALADLPLGGDGSGLLQTIVDACDANDGFDALSVNTSGYWPLLLTACRHYRLPVPPQFWIHALVPATPPASSPPATPATSSLPAAP